MIDENRSEDEQIGKYRLVVMNDETFEELNSFRVTKSKLFLTIGGILGGIIFILWATMALTPLKRILFGYGDSKLRNQMVDITVHVDSLEKALADRDHYILNMTRRLTGNLEGANSSLDIPPGFTMDKMKTPAASTSEPTEPAKPIAEAPKEEIPQKEEPITKASTTTSADIFSIPYKPSNMYESVKRDGESTDLSDIFFTPPIKGYITAEFQPGKKHFGIDIAAPKNTPIKSALDGVIIHSDWTLETGNVIGIQHNGNLVTFYKHNSLLLKKVGSFVKAGEAVAIIGNTGELSDGPHLHFEIWHNGQAVNPSDYLNF